MKNDLRSQKEREPTGARVPDVVDSGVPGISPPRTPRRRTAFRLGIAGKENAT